jgi:hypothetical protein
MVIGWPGQFSMRLAAISVTFFCLISWGCAQLAFVDESSRRIDASIEKYSDQARVVQLGDPKEKVLSILVPTQEDLKPDERKSAESFLKNDVRTDIYFFRSRRQGDGLTTDDEFTPYVFTNGVLTAVGWTALGGPKTQGQVPSAGPNPRYPLSDK